MKTLRKACLILLLNISSAGWAQIQIPGLSPSTQPVDRSYETPLSAYTFYDPIHEKNLTPRGNDWPEELTFLNEERPRTAEQVHQMLQGSWGVRFHCDRKPVTASFLAAQDIGDGYINIRVEYEISERILTKNMFHPSSLATDPPQNFETWEYSIKPSKESANKFDLFVISRRGNEQLAWTIKLRRVQETGEFIFTMPMDQYGDYECPSGNPVEFILAPKIGLTS